MIYKINCIIIRKSIQQIWQVGVVISLLDFELKGPEFKSQAGQQLSVNK